MLRLRPGGAFAAVTLALFVGATAALAQNRDDITQWVKDAQDEFQKQPRGRGKTFEQFAQERVGRVPPPLRPGENLQFGVPVQQMPDGSFRVPDRGVKNLHTELDVVLVRGEPLKPGSAIPRDKLVDVWEATQTRDLKNAKQAAAQAEVLGKPPVIVRPTSTGVPPMRHNEEVAWRKTLPSDGMHRPLEPEYTDDVTAKYPVTSPHAGKVAPGTKIGKVLGSPRVKIGAGAIIDAAFMLVDLANGKPIEEVLTDAAAEAIAWWIVSAGDAVIYPALIALGPGGWIAAGAYTVAKILLSRYLSQKLGDAARKGLGIGQGEPPKPADRKTGIVQKLNTDVNK